MNLMNFRNVMGSFVVSRLAVFALTGFLLSTLATSQAFADTVLIIDRPPSTDTQQALDGYADRIAHMRSEVPDIVEAAEAAASRVLADPNTSLIFAGKNNRNWFLREFLSRAGGLANSGYRIKPGKYFNPGDVILVAAADWDEQGEEFLEELPKYREQDCLIIMFGPKEGAPEGLVYDYLIDTGNAASGESTRHVNAAAALTLGWMWCCEYASALSRNGKSPGILWTKAHKDAWPHNDPLQEFETMRWLGDTDQPVEAGKLANVYLDRAEQLIEDLRSESLQAQLDRAADIIATRMNNGVKVYISSTGHAVPHEMLREDGRAPWSYLYRSRLPRDEVLNQFKDGELLVWIGYLGYVGLERRGTDLREVLRDKGVDMIVSEAPVPPRDSKPEVAWEILMDPLEDSPVVATIDQHWELPDAEVDLPWTPGFMAPISGVNADLLYRMLDEEVVQRLKPASE